MMAPRIEGHERDACTAKIPWGQLQPEGYGPAGENEPDPQTLENIFK
jgi:hypothetical protein